MTRTRTRTKRGQNGGEDKMENKPNDPSELREAELHERFGISDQNVILTVVISSIEDKRNRQIASFGHPR